MRLARAAWVSKWLGRRFCMSGWFKASPIVTGRKGATHEKSQVQQAYPRQTSRKAFALLFYPRACPLSLSANLASETCSALHEDAQHAAQRLGRAPQQLVTNREGANVLRPHRHLA